MHVCGGGRWLGGIDVRCLGKLLEVIVVTVNKRGIFMFGLWGLLCGLEIVLSFILSVGGLNCRSVVLECVGVWVYGCMVDGCIAV